MSKLIKVLLLDEVSMIYLFKIIMIGIIHKRKDISAYGVVIGIWRFQIQLTTGYSEELVSTLDKVSGDMPSA